VLVIHQDLKNPKCSLISWVGPRSCSLNDFSILLLHRSFLCLCTNSSITLVLYVYLFIGRVSQTYLLPYSTTKFAIEGFFGGLRAELQSRGISLTMCYLGLVGMNGYQNKLLFMITNKNAYEQGPNT